MIRGQCGKRSNLGGFCKGYYLSTEIKLKPFTNFNRRHDGNTPTNRRKHSVSARRVISTQMNHKPNSNEFSISEIEV